MLTMRPPLIALALLIAVDCTPLTASPPDDLAPSATTASEASPGDVFTFHIHGMRRIRGHL